jgi:hypothetical protein
MKKFFNYSTLFLFISIGLIVYLYQTYTPENLDLDDSSYKTLISADLMQYPFETSKLGASSSVKILGINKSNDNYHFLVDTYDGRRGLIRQDVLDRKAVYYGDDIEKDGFVLRKLDTLRIINTSGKGDSYEFRYIVKNKDDVTGEIESDDVVSLLAHKYSKYATQDESRYIISKSKFDSTYIGKTFEEMDSLYMRATSIAVSGKSRDAYYRIRIFDKQEGTFYNPIVNFQDGVAQSYAPEYLTAKSRKANGTILKYLPLSSQILNVGAFSFLVNKSTYTKNGDLFYTPNIFINILIKTLGILYLLFSLVWLVACGFLPSMFIFGLVVVRYPLIFVGNKGLGIALKILNVIALYIWAVLILTSPIYWWISIPLIVTFFIFFNKAIDAVLDIDVRCPECKRLYSSFYDREEFVREYDKWERSDEKGAHISSKTSKWQTYDLETTRTYNGLGECVGSSSRKVNVKDHEKRYDKYKMNVYNVLYHIKEYKVIYVCDGCGKELYGSRIDRSELKKDYKGTYTKEEVNTIR